jgi:hypothetical protein
MPKVILEFDAETEQEALSCAINGAKYKDRLDEIWQQLFRPRHKHGYSNQLIQDCLGMEVAEEDETEAHKACHALMDALEAIYREVVYDD